LSRSSRDPTEFSAVTIAFKFLNKKFVESFLERGVVKIGTAKEFRIPDGFDAARSDECELITEWRPGEAPEEAARTIEVTREHPFISDIGGKIHPEQTLRMKFEKRAVVKVHTDAFLYCVSSEVTEHLRTKMLADFGADACVEIADFEIFAALLSGHRRLAGLCWAAGYVKYQDDDPLVYSGSDVFKKRTKYTWQREMRIVWTGDGIPDVGEVIEVPSLTSFSLLKQIY
jgi:hypothetical protein